MYSFPDETYYERDRAFTEALRVMLEEVQPPWWRIDLRIGLAGRRQWALTCASYNWPGWFDAARRCGVDSERMIGIYMLIHGHRPVLLDKRSHFPL